VTPQTVGGDIIDIFVSSLALGCVAIFIDYVTTLNPARYVRKRLKESLERHSVFNSNGPPISNRHPLDDAEPSDDDDDSDRVKESFENQGVIIVDLNDPSIPDRQPLDDQPPPDDESYH
jgi:hypothetical protein